MAVKGEYQSIRAAMSVSLTSEILQSCPSMLACFCSDKRMMDEVKEEQMDKVELAFRKFDLDGDGFLSWEEFQQVGLNAFKLVNDKGVNNESKIHPFPNLSGGGRVPLKCRFLFQLGKDLDQEQALRIFTTCNQVSNYHSNQVIIAKLSLCGEELIRTY